MRAPAPKLRRHNGRIYRIEGYPVFLVSPCASKLGWSIKEFAFSPATRAWLRASGLLQARFSTRARALDAFIQAAALSPPPEEKSGEEVPKLIRSQDGSYRSRCGHWQVTRVRGGWSGRRDSALGVQQEAEQIGATLSTIALQIDNIENGKRKREAQRELYLSWQPPRG